jgi:hypothetical protein
VNDDAFAALLEFVAAAVRNNSRASHDTLISLLQSGAIPNDAVWKALRQFEGDFYETLADAYGKVLGVSMGVQKIRSLPVSGLALSTQLYDHQRAISDEVLGIVKRHAQGMHDARSLAMDIYEGYGFKDRDPLKLSPTNQKLPRYLREVLRDKGLRADFARVIAKGQVSTLRTPALRAAYMQAIDSFGKVAGKKRLERVLDVAYQERMRYFASRISQTELSRAHADEKAREFMGEQSLTVLQWRMSGTHPKTDICDMHSSLDKYGIGAGCYPKELAPKPPAHPFCRCKLVPRWDLSSALAKDRAKAEQAFLINAGDTDGAKIMGSRAKWTEAKTGKSSVEEILNRNKDALYHLKRVGDFPAGKNQMPVVGDFVDAAKVAQFVEQKTAKAAAKWAVDNDLADYADYTGVKPEVANAFNRSLFDHLQEFPELRKNQQFIGTCQAQVKRWAVMEREKYLALLVEKNPNHSIDFLRPYAVRGVKLPKIDNRYAHSSPRNGVAGIAVNTKWGSDVERFKDALSRDTWSGYHPTGCNTIRSVVDHELGHELDKLLGMEVDNEVILAYEKAMASGIGDEVSRYADKNIKEFIAECWAESLNNPAARPYARTIAGIVRARYRAKFGPP